MDDSLLSRKPRIVVADDFETLRRGLIAILGEAVCGEAENGQQAIQRVVELRPHLVILDLTMPVMNGFEAARAIRSLAPETKILVFSMHDGNAVKQEALRAGADRLLSKTTKAEEILQTVAELLSPLGLDTSMGPSKNKGRNGWSRNTAAST
jgi:DNA-binding NarL/FixJ family response regulator